MFAYVHNAGLALTCVYVSERVQVQEKYKYGTLSSEVKMVWTWPPPAGDVDEDDDDPDGDCKACQGVTCSPRLPGMPITSRDTA